RPRAVPAWLLRLGMPEPSLDRHPALWREWHRRQPSAWSRGLWKLYAVLTTLFTVLALIGHDIAPGGNGFSVSVALLVVSASSATVLAEERVQGSLDVVLATPLPTREIVLAKWWGAFRIIPSLAVLPALLNVAIGLSRNRWHPWPGLVAAALSIFLVLSY